MNPLPDSEGVASIEQITRLEKALFDNVSHELKTPLTVIVAALDQPDPDRAEIAEAVRRLTRTIDNFLIAARIDAGQMKPRSEWCEPGELTQEAVASISAEDHEIRVTIAPDLPLVFVDARFIERVLGILLFNAITHSASTDVVDLTVTRNKDVFVWSVLDRGPGLGLGEETRVFTKFYRGAGRPTGGLGLGLFIAKKLAELLGATLSASNRPDGGGCFTLCVPIREFPVPLTDRGVS